MKILVLNCGSSSLKYQLIDSETESHYLQKVFAKESVSTAFLSMRQPERINMFQTIPFPITQLL